MSPYSNSPGDIGTYRHLTVRTVDARGHTDISLYEQSRGHTDISLYERLPRDIHTVDIWTLGVLTASSGHTYTVVHLDIKSTNIFTLISIEIEVSLIFS